MMETDDAYQYWMSFQHDEHPLVSYRCVIWDEDRIIPLEQYLEEQKDLIYKLNNPEL